MAERDLSGQVVAITGGARGIGRATAQACARAGMRVAIGDLDAALSEAAAREVGAEALGLRVDVRDRELFGAFLDEVEARLGPLDVLVNNAGVLFLGPFVEEDPARTRMMLEVNLAGVMSGTQLALARFQRRGAGHIVNLASSAGLVGVAGGATYAATKHAVVGFTRALRGELRGSAIRTTIVMPGIVRTDMIGGFRAAPATRIIEPAAVAEAIVRALRSQRAEVIVPVELGPLARLVAGLPPRAADPIRRALGVDRVMMNAERPARAAYEQRAEA